MSDILLEIQDLIKNTELSFQDIAKQLNVPVDMVYDVADDMGEFDE